MYGTKLGHLHKAWSRRRPGGFICRIPCSEGRDSFRGTSSLLCSANRGPDNLFQLYRQFSVARGIASAAAGVTSFAVDQTVFGGNSVARPLLQGAVSTVFNVAEQFTLAPIYLGEYITSTSVLAAHSTINALSVIFPGSNEASFSLVAFIDLVRREWRQAEDPQRPEKHYGLTKVAWAIVGWVSLQGVTQEWQEKRWLKHLKEIDVNAVRPTPLSRKCVYPIKLLCRATNAQSDHLASA